VTPTTGARFAVAPGDPWSFRVTGPDRALTWAGAESGGRRPRSATLGSAVHYSRYFRRSKAVWSVRSDFARLVYASLAKLTRCDRRLPILLEGSGLTHDARRAPGAVAKASDVGEGVQTCG
jgi:hypothetical protein